jgi:hypothetical protein
MSTLAEALVDLTRRLGKTPDKNEMINAINNALYDIGGATQIDETLNVVDDQTEYDLPTDVYNVVKIEVQNSAADNDSYHEITRWHEASGKIYFPEELEYTEGNAVRLYYNAVPSTVDDDTDTISDDIPLPLLAAVAAYHYHWSRYLDRSNISAKDEMVLQKALNDRQIAESRWRVHRLDREYDVDLDQSINYVPKESK